MVSVGEDGVDEDSSADGEGNDSTNEISIQEEEKPSPPRTRSSRGLKIIDYKNLM